MMAPSGWQDLGDWVMCCNLIFRWDAVSQLPSERWKLSLAGPCLGRFVSSRNARSLLDGAEIVLAACDDSTSRSS
ncbi:unnamed protein product [Sphagnum jensenii]|jgi:hypothetical protein|uniref:Uncharacterized protein n=1 Tax=Sphagnum jensenii TaxID=128206 RepID=A0ABP0XDG7_9BRYO